MTEHVHGCLNCRPDMVPEFRQDDPRYHDADVCGTPLRGTVDGVEPGYHKGVYEGEDGWVLLACEGFNVELIHPCPTCTTYDAEGFTENYEVCLEPRFGLVAVTHECARRLAKRAARLEAALEPLLSQAAYLHVRYGEESGVPLDAAPGEEDG